MSVKKIGKALREEGYEIGTRKIWNEQHNQISAKVILNLILKPLKPLKNSIEPYKETSENLGSFGGLGIQNEEKLQITEHKI